MKGQNSEYRYTDWNEVVEFERPDGSRTASVKAAAVYSGFISGATSVVFLMHHMHDNTGSYSGYENFKGTVDGENVSLVFRHEGTFDLEGVNARVASIGESSLGSMVELRLSCSERFIGQGPYQIRVKVD